MYTVTLLSGVPGFVVTNWLDCCVTIRSGSPLLTFKELRKCIPLRWFFPLVDAAERFAVEAKFLRVDAAVSYAAAAG
jgi:hypothetical protein